MKEYLSFFPIAGAPVSTRDTGASVTSVMSHEISYSTSVHVCSTAVCQI